MNVLHIVVLTLTSCSSALRIEEYKSIPETSRVQASASESQGEYFDNLEADLPQDLLDRLWAGEDVVPEMFCGERTSPSRSIVYPTPKLVVLGPQDSGTHLLMSFLARNVPAFTWRCKPSHEGCAALWKHSLGKEGIYNTLGGDSGNVQAVLLVRSPLSQVHSWKKAPWDMKKCVNRTPEKYGRPCFAALQATKAKDHAGMPASLIPEWYNSTMDVYNKYMETYKGLLHDGKLMAVHMVTYEDLIYTPEKALRAIGKTMGWELPENITIVENSSKGAMNHGRDEALQKLKNRSYLAGLAKAKEILCRDLDRALIEDVTEGTYTDEPKNYAVDCDTIM